MTGRTTHSSLSVAACQAAFVSDRVLEFVPARAEWIAALIEGDGIFTERFGWRVEPGWIGFPEALPHLLTTVPRQPGSVWGPQCITTVATDATRTLVGIGGWKGQPDHAGAAELGYSVAPSHQGRGIASQFVAWSVEVGRRHGVTTAVAHTSPDHGASTSVLARQRFRQVGTTATDDPAAPEVWRWERLLTPRLTLEPLDLAHAPGLLAALADDAVGEYIGGPDVTTLDALHARIDYLATTDPGEWGERWLNWVVIADDLEPPTVVGRIEATLHLGRSPASAEIAYLFGPTWWGEGYATEAGLALLRMLAADHGVEQAWATVDPRNRRSIALLERLGFESTALPPEGIGSYDDGDLVFGRRLNG